jgi:hypothetical protein
MRARRTRTEPDPVKLFIASILLGKSPAHVREVLESVAVDADCDGDGMYGIYLEVANLGLRDILSYYRELSPMWDPTIIW